MCCFVNRNTSGHAPFGCGSGGRAVAARVSVVLQPARRLFCFRCDPGDSFGSVDLGNLIQVRGALAVPVVAGLPLIASGKLGRDIGEAVSLHNTFTRPMVQRLITGEKLYG